MTKSVNQRLKEALALWMIGEGVIGAMRPRRYLQLWRFGPRGYQKFIDSLTAHPTAMRVVGVAEAGVGVWWALRQISR